VLDITVISSGVFRNSGRGVLRAHLSAARGGARAVCAGAVRVHIKGSANRKFSLLFVLLVVENL
jgi:hypothetical protein